MDGYCWPLTLAAIARFQLQQSRWTDRRIDPGEVIIRRLSTPAVSAPQPPARPPLPHCQQYFVEETIDPTELLATLQSMSGEVTHNGEPARAGARPFAGHRIGPFDSTARLAMTDGGGIIDVGPHSIVVLLGRRHHHLRSMEVTLQTGRLRDPAVLRQLRGQP